MRRPLLAEVMVLVLLSACGGGQGETGDPEGAECGDGQRGTDEACDGDDLGGLTCTSLGLAGGTLACTASCTMNIQGCAFCGNNRRDPSEGCDGTDVLGLDCVDAGFDG